MWDAMGPLERMPYVELAAQDRLRYERVSCILLAHFKLLCAYFDADCNCMTRSYCTCKQECAAAGISITGKKAPTAYNIFVSMVQPYSYTLFVPTVVFPIDILLDDVCF